MQQDYKKVQGYKAESVVIHYLQKKWFYFVERNYQIRGWEIDIIMIHNHQYVFVEVKMIDWMDDIMDHIHKSKITSLTKTIKKYCYDHKIHDAVQQILFVYVKSNKIYSYFYLE